MSTANTQEQNEHIKAILAEIQSKFARLAISYGMTIRAAERGELSGADTVCLECDSKELAALAKQLRGQLRGGVS